MLRRADLQYLYTGGQAPEAHPIHAAAWDKLFGFRATWGLIVGFFGSV